LIYLPFFYFNHAMRSPPGSIYHQKNSPIVSDHTPHFNPFPTQGIDYFSKKGTQKTRKKNK
jgi:hypothetical protein